MWKESLVTSFKVPEGTEEHPKKNSEMVLNVLTKISTRHLSNVSLKPKPSVFLLMLVPLHTAVHCI